MSNIFLCKKVCGYDVLLISVTQPKGPQLLEARVERLYSAGKAIDSNQLGGIIEFVHSPASWGLFRWCREIEL